MEGPQPPQGGGPVAIALVAGFLSLLGRKASSSLLGGEMDVRLGPGDGASGAGASTGSAPDTPPNSFSLRKSDSTATNVVSRTEMDCEVFGEKSLADVVATIRKLVARTDYLATANHLDDAVSVATLALLEYWIPRFATEDTRRNYYFAVRYGTYRAGDHLLNEGDEIIRKVSLEDEYGGNLPKSLLVSGGRSTAAELRSGANVGLTLEDVLPDPTPIAEEQVCSDALVAAVREIVGELDFEAALSRETTRQEAKRTGRNQKTVHRNRVRAKMCVRNAYRTCM